MVHVKVPDSPDPHSEGGDPDRRRWYLYHIVD